MENIRVRIHRVIVFETAVT